MALRTPGRRFVVWGNKNPFTMAVIFDLLIVLGFAWALQKQNTETVARAKEQVVAETKARDERIAAANLDVCKRAVAAVTDQLNADLLQVMKTVEGRFADQGKPIPGVYLQLELVLTNRQPPLAVCEPKENP